MPLLPSMLSTLSRCVKTGLYARANPSAWLSTSTDNGLAVRTTSVHLLETFKPLPVKHFGRPLTLRTSLRKGIVRPESIGNEERIGFVRVPTFPRTRRSFAVNLTRCCWFLSAHSCPNGQTSGRCRRRLRLGTVLCNHRSTDRQAVRLCRRGTAARTLHPESAR